MKRVRRTENSLILTVGLFALTLRLIPWLANLPLHHDEALYGAWARSIADSSDPLLLIPWVDKPPLVLYLLAGGIKLFGTSELALRAPGMIAGLFTVFATYGLTRHLYGERVALGAAALFALSPFAILFGPTAFTDPWLTLFFVAAAWAALARRPLWAGLLAGLAAASKQQGIFAAPLILALMAITPPLLPAGLSAVAQERGRRERWVLAVLGFGLVFGLITYWDSLRWHNRPSYWDQSLQTYGGVALVALAEWPARVREWAGQVGLLFGGWWLTAPVLIAATGAVWKCRTDAFGQTDSRVGGVLAQTSRRAGRGLAQTSRRAGRDRPGINATGYTATPPQGGWMLRGGLTFPGAGVILGAYILGYIATHIAFTFQPWDRYLLPILPLICVLAAQGMAIAWRAVTDRGRATAAAIAGSVAIYAASLGVTAAIPVGSDVGAYDGVAEAAAFLAAQPGAPTVYYDRLGWHLEYYLYGLPVTRSWYDSPQKLASETARVAAARPGSAQWLALPAWEESKLAGLAVALAARGFAAQPEVEVVAADGRTIDLTLYRLIPAPPEVAASSAHKSATP